MPKKDINESKQGFWNVLARKAKAIIDDDNTAQSHEIPHVPVTVTSDRGIKDQVSRCWIKFLSEFLQVGSCRKIFRWQQDQINFYPLFSFVSDWQNDRISTLLQLFNCTIHDFHRIDLLFFYCFNLRSLLCGELYHLIMDCLSKNLFGLLFPFICSTMTQKALLKTAGELIIHLYRRDQIRLHRPLITLVAPLAMLLR